MNFNLNFTAYAKIDSVFIINLNVNHKMINLFEEKIETLQKLDLGEELLEMIQVKFDKLDFIKFKNFCSVKDHVKNRQVQTGRKYLHIMYLIPHIFGI